MNTTYTAIVKIEAGGAVANLEEIDKTVKASNSNLIAMRKELKSVQSELLALEPGSAAFNKLASRAGELRDRMNDVSEQINANAGPALESIGNQAGLLQSKLMNLDIAGVGESFSALGANIRRVSFKDLQAGIQGVGKGLADMGRALLANPIFLLGGALVALVANFDKVTKAIDYGVNPATRELVEQTRKLSEVSKTAYEAFDLEERRLRALGVAEDEIAEKRKQASIARLTQIKFELEANQKLLSEQVSAYVESAGVATNGLDALVQGVKKLFGPAEEEINAIKETITARGKEAEEIGVRILELDKKRTDEAVKNSETRKKSAEDETDALSKLAEERLREVERIEEVQTMIADRRKEINDSALEEFKKTKDAELEINRNSLLQQQADEINAANAKKELNQQEFNSRLALGQSLVSSLSSLNDSLVDAGLVSAKRGFNISKGLAIAQATADTYKGAVGAFSQAVSTFPPPAGPILGAVFAGVAVAAGIAQIAKISRTKFDANGGGGGGGGGATFSAPSVGAGASVSPTFNPLNTQFLQNRPPQQPSVRAYVVANDVASEQEASEKINALSTL